MGDAIEEPFRIQWTDGSCPAGYLGGKCWRCRLSTDVVHSGSTTSEAAALLVGDVLAGTTAGNEVRQRAPVSVRVGLVEDFRLAADSRMFNGWAFASERSRGDLGDHAHLAPWIEALLARHADNLWAHGRVPSDPAPLGDKFAFAAFRSGPDPTVRCRRLEAELSDRLAAHPSPEAVLERAAKELRALGHDLWSWEPDRVWGRDYVTKRDGAGLTLSLLLRDDDDGEPASPHITVEFEPPR